MRKKSIEISKEAVELAKLPFAVTITAGEAGGEPCFVAYNPEIPGCMAQGRTPEEAVESLVEAREMCIEGMLEYGVPVPEPRTSAGEK